MANKISKNPISYKNIDKIITNIETLEKDLRVIGMRSTPDIVGFYGELLVWRELKKRFPDYEVEFGSGQSKADIILRKNGKRINVEVKTSRLKEEWHGLGYGYALNIKKCKKHADIFYSHPKRGQVPGDFCYFDYLVAVLLSDDLKKKNFYVFPRDLIIKHEKDLRNRNTRFSSATHRMVFLGKPNQTDEITKFDKYLVKHKNKFNNWKLKL